jgi:hypothetical protein
MIVKAEGPSDSAKIRSYDPKHALGLAQYLRTIGYNAWIEDTNGDEIEETILKMAIKSAIPASEFYKSGVSNHHHGQTQERTVCNKGADNGPISDRSIRFPVSTPISLTAVMPALSWPLSNAFWQNSSAMRTRSSTLIGKSFTASVVIEGFPASTATHGHPTAQFPECVIATASFRADRRFGVLARSVPSWTPPMPRLLADDPNH